MMPLYGDGRKAGLESDVDMKKKSSLNNAFAILQPNVSTGELSVLAPA
jgi:hypothetical protein